MATNVVRMPARRKREPHAILIQFDRQFIQGRVLKGYVGKAAPRWFRIDVEWLWRRPFSELSIAERGALVTLIMMVMRSRDAFDQGMAETTWRELRWHGVTEKILRRLCSNFAQLTISVVTETGEVKDL